MKNLKKNKNKSTRIRPRISQTSAWKHSTQSISPTQVILCMSSPKSMAWRFVSSCVSWTSCSNTWKRDRSRKLSLVKMYIPVFSFVFETKWQQHPPQRTPPLFKKNFICCVCVLYFFPSEITRRGDRGWRKRIKTTGKSTPEDKSGNRTLSLSLCVCCVCVCLLCGAPWPWKSTFQKFLFCFYSSNIRFRSKRLKHNWKSYGVAKTWNKKAKIR